MNKTLCLTPTRNGQRGIVLVMASMFLIALTIVVISLMRTTIQEERMVANSRDWNNAFQAAEAALRDAEQEVIAHTRVSGMTGFELTCSATGLCLPNLCTGSSDCKPIWITLAASDTPWKDGSSGTSKSVEYGTNTSATSLPGLTAQPRYIIEGMQVPVSGGSLKTGTDSSVTTLYRVTAVGFGVNTSSRVMLQAVIRPAG